MVKITKKNNITEIHEDVELIKFISGYGIIIAKKGKIKVYDDRKIRKVEVIPK